MPWYASEGFSIFMFLAPPVAALLALYFIQKKLIWLSVPITLVIDALFWGPVMIKAGSYGGVLWVFLIPQVIVVALISLLVIWRTRGR